MAELEQLAMALIIHSGNARTCAYEAFELAMAGDFAGAAAKLKEAAAELSQAHAQQTNLIQDEAQGKGVAPSLLLVHAQDHLMTAVTEVNLIERLIRIVEVRR
jgi:PTS system cellobiose-specific IIA component